MHSHHNGLKTAALLGLLTAMILAVGYWLGGSEQLQTVVRGHIGQPGNHGTAWAVTDHSGASDVRTVIGVHRRDRRHRHPDHRILAYAGGWTASRRPSSNMASPAPNRRRGAALGSASPAPRCLTGVPFVAEWIYLH